MRLTSFLGLVSLVAAAVESPALARPSLPPDSMLQLAHYKVLTYADPAGGGINKGKAIGLFDATPDELYRVLTDYARYPEFAPRVISARVVDRRGEGRAIVELRTDLPWPVSEAWVLAEFDEEQLAGNTYRVRFWQVKGSLKRYSGSLLIEPWQTWKRGGTSTLTYELVAEPDSSAPRRLINNRVEEAVSKYVHALRQHVNDLRRLGLLHPQAPPQPNLASPVHAVEDLATRK